MGFNSTFSSRKSSCKKPLIVAFKSNKSKNTALIFTPESISTPVEEPIEKHKRPRGSKKSSEKTKATDEEALFCYLDLDYNEAAAKLENLYKLSPTIDPPDVETIEQVAKKGRRRRQKVDQDEEKLEPHVVRNVKSRLKRLSLDRRIALRKRKDVEMIYSSQKKDDIESEDQRINKLVREYSASTDLNNLDWKKMKIPPVLPSAEHAWLFKLMQPMKAILQVKGTLQKDLGREPTDGELADALNMTVVRVRKDLEIGRASRNKLIKHNLRLVLFVINKYFQEFANGPNFQDLCQAGVKGLIASIDRFEPKRKSRLSTYGLFWIRHAIIRSMTLSSFTRVPFGLESVRLQIHRAKQELSSKLQRVPTEDEIIEKVGISPERYREVMKASKPVASLHARHAVTQEQFIDGITDTEGVGGDKRRQPALLRLALDDVLDSLKPKESLVIRQRYGLDGKGDRTLGEIAGNLNISREMVRKHEVKALMKLKHPTRVDYLRRYVY